MKTHIRWTELHFVSVLCYMSRNMLWTLTNVLFLYFTKGGRACHPLDLYFLIMYNILEKNDILNISQVAYQLIK